MTINGSKSLRKLYIVFATPVLKATYILVALYRNCPVDVPKTKKILRKLITIFLLWVGTCTLSAQEGPLPELIFSTEGGYYDTTFAVSLYYPQPDVTIYYTLDGSSPTTNGIRYSKPIPIRKSSNLRAAILNNRSFGKIYSYTYLIDEPDTELPTLAISIDPDLLFDSEKGLFMLGSQANLESSHMSGANFWSRREVPAHLEFYESDGRCVFNSALGFRLFGGMSRLLPQKSMALITRDEYGKSKIKHPIFGKEGPKSFDYLVLRNGGSDFGRAHARDAIATRQAADWAVDVQAYRPAQVYINGQYWGLYNLREKINRHFLADHHDVDKDSLDLLEHNMTLKRGSRRHYQRMIRYIEQHDLSEAEHYQQIKEWMDIESFIDFQVAQIFFDNHDGGGNIRYWRPQTEDGKWRWILFDLDWAMGLHEHDAYRFNSLLFHIRPDGPAWPNPPWSTFLLRNLLKNSSFQQVFVTRFSDHLNDQLSTEALLSTINETQTNLEGEIDRHFERWNLSRRTWERHFNRMRAFAQKRPDFMRQHLQEYFDLADSQEIEIQVEAGGKVLFNRHLSIRQDSFNGSYFSDYPIHLLAIPNLGHRFLYWENARGERITSPALLEAVSDSRQSYRAIFEPYQHPLTETLVINEIMPTGKPSQDWIELYNRSDERLYLDDFIISDKLNNRFVFPERSSVGPHDYLVICQDMQRFRKIHPMSYNLIGDLGFGINKHRETIALFDDQGAMIDSVGYVLEPTDIDFSRSLLIPRLDNADPENWQIHFDAGTPNTANPYYVASSIQVSQKKWMQISLAAGILLVLAALIYLSWVRMEA